MLVFFDGVLCKLNCVENMIILRRTFFIHFFYFFIYEIYFYFHEITTTDKNENCIKKCIHTRNKKCFEYYTTNLFTNFLYFQIIKIKCILLFFISMRQTSTKSLIPFLEVVSQNQFDYKRKRHLTLRILLNYNFFLSTSNIF